MEALDAFASHIAQRADLGRVLDAFGHQAQAERAAEGDDRGNQRGGVRIGPHVSDDAAVDLQPNERRTATIGQRRIARAHNLTEQLNDVTAHAEMQAFTSASGFMGGKYLEGCTLFVTVEPCVMCAGASFWTQISRIVYGAKDTKRGYSLLSSSVLHPRTKVSSGVLAEDCGVLMKDFFRRKR